MSNSEDANDGGTEEAGQYSLATLAFTALGSIATTCALLLSFFEWSSTEPFDSAAVSAGTYPTALPWCTEFTGHSAVRSGSQLWMGVYDPAGLGYFFTRLNQNSDGNWDSGIIMLGDKTVDVHHHEQIYIFYADDAFGSFLRGARAINDQTVYYTERPPGIDLSPTFTIERLADLGAVNAAGQCPAKGATA